MSVIKFKPTHNIVVPMASPRGIRRLTIPVMESQGDLWQRGELSRGEPFPIWRLVNGQLEHRHGQLPANTTIITLNATGVRGGGVTHPGATRPTKPTTDPTPRMLDVMRAMRRAADDGRELTPNEIGLACGLPRGNLRPTRDGRSMGPAQRVIFSLVGLRRRGMATRGRRRADGLSGSTYRLTDAGRKFCDDYRL